ncbi:MAG: hypothetical protein HYW34_00225 [Candidatus Brennerbacteria bacterium]|nr:hypothetical protein [Candidatus Brennerbacteria bacterium]
MTEPTPPIRPFKPQPVFNKTLVIVIIAATGCLFLIIGFFSGYYYFSGSFEKTAIIIQPEIPQNPAQTATSTTALSQPENNTSSVQTAPSFTTVQSPANEINAKILTSIDLNYQFSLKEYPETEFKIVKITKTWGGVPIRGLRTPCNYVEQDKPIFIFIKDIACIETSKKTDNAASALVIAEIEINNKSGAEIYGRFLQLMYDVKNNEQSFQRLATANPNWTGYGAAPFSSKNIIIGFIIPETQNEINLLYGNYGAVLNQNDGEALLSKTISGLTIDFAKKTFSEIQG